MNHRSNDPYAGSYGGSSGTHGSLLWGGAVSAAAGNSRPVTPPPTAKPPGPDLTVRLNVSNACLCLFMDGGKSAGSCWQMFGQLRVVD